MFYAEVSSLWDHSNDLCLSGTSFSFLKKYERIIIMITNVMLYKFACAIITSLYDQEFITLDEAINMKKDLRDKFGYYEEI
jgi:hypothetical protein